VSPAHAIDLSEFAAKMTPTVKPRIRLVFTHITPKEATWPYQGYDYEGRKKELTDRLRCECPNVEFLPVTVQNKEQATRLLEASDEIDGYLVYMVGIWTEAPQVIASSGKPVLLVDDLYAGSGEFLIAYAAARRKGQKVAGVSSTRFEDVVQGVKCFECLKKLQASAILDVTDREKLWGDPVAIHEVLGAKVRQISSQEMNEAYRKADQEEAREWAKYWIQKARRVVEPSREEIEKSGVIFLAMVDLMQQHQAQAIAVDCLGLFYGGKLPAYPCLGFFQLNNDGLVGACEGDLQSTGTMLIMNYLVGRPGYISDPVIDTSKNQIIYAHCVAPTKVFGPTGKRNRYDIRSHSEDRKGACVRSLMPLKEMTTTLEFNPTRKEVVIHQGQTVSNIDEDKACRNKLAVEVKGDINNLMTQWDQWGWHRVTFYGDHKQAVEMISAMLGFEVILEA
jgi:L-fucose isomerase-like protein